MYRNSLVKSFEMTLEQDGKLLRKKLTPFFAGKKAVDSLNFKDLFRYALKFSLMTENEVNRWFKYRDNRNNTAHDYGVGFAEDTLLLIDDNKAVLRRSASLNREPWRLRCLIRHSKGSLTFLIASLSRTFIKDVQKFKVMIENE